MNESASKSSISTITYEDKDIRGSYILFFGRTSKFAVFCVIIIAILFLTPGCQKTDQVHAGLDDQGIHIETDAPQAPPHSAPRGQPEQRSEPEPSQINDELEALAPGPDNREDTAEHSLENQEEMIKKELIIQKAHEKELVYSESYQRSVSELKASPAGENMDDEKIEQTALIETFLEELTSELSFPDEKLISVFEKHEHNMPEDADFETLKPHIEQLLVNEYIEEYIKELDAEAEIEVNHKWLAQKLKEAHLERDENEQEVPQ